MPELRPSLSPAAGRLLDLLQRCCCRRDAAMPDRWLANELGCNVREVIDLADELLREGWLVVAETSAPYGRWLVVDSEDLAAGRSYANSLGRRAVSIWRRRKSVRAAVEATSIRLRTAPDQAGQMWLFEETPLDNEAGDNVHGRLTDRRGQSVAALQEARP